MEPHTKTELYILDHCGPEDPVLHELERETHLKVLGARMISGHYQGKLLAMFSAMIQPERILELGTFTGYSAICLARGLKTGGQLVTIEIDDELDDMTSRFIRKTGLENQIIRKTGPALEIIRTLEGTFDLVFIDADKREYPAYYNAVFPLVRNGGYIIADNTLWNGKVLSDPAPGDDQTRGVAEFNDLVARDPRVEKIILPVRDGLTIIRKI